MNTSRPVRALTSLMLALLAGCGGPTTIRTGKALIRPPASPPCARTEGFTVVPTRVFVQATDGSLGYVVRIREETVEGLGLYRRGALVPVPEALPELDEPDLAELHRQRIEPIQDKIDVGLGWVTASLILDGAALGALGVGAVGLFTDNDDLSIGGLITAAGLLGVALLALIPAAVHVPTMQERTYLGVRTRVLLADEDDLDAVERGVRRYNDRVAAECR